MRRRRLLPMCFPRLPHASDERKRREISPLPEGKSELLVFDDALLDSEFEFDTVASALGSRNIGWGREAAPVARIELDDRRD